MGYTKDRELTPKGIFAKQIYGYEIQVAEFIEAGILSRLTEDQLNVLFNAIVFEARKGDWFRPLAKELMRPWKFKALDLVEKTRNLEGEFGITTPTKEMDYRMASCIWAWSRGCPFADLEAHTSLSDGDMVRYMRLGVQLQRQTVRALMDYPHFANDPYLAEKLKTAAAKVSRDVVDAEKQLRQG